MLIQLFLDPTILSNQSIFISLGYLVKPRLQYLQGRDVYLNNSFRKNIRGWFLGDGDSVYIYKMLMKKCK